MAVLDLHALTEERVRLVEEQQDARALADVEHVAQALFGLADVLVDHPGQIDAVEVQPQFACDHLGGHGLACAAGAAEQGGDTVAEVGQPLEAPVLEHRPAQPHMRLEVPQLAMDVRGQDQVLPAVGAGQRRQEFALRRRRAPQRVTHRVRAAGSGAGDERDLGRGQALRGQDRRRRPAAVGLPDREPFRGGQAGKLDRGRVGAGLPVRRAAAQDQVAQLPRRDPVGPAHLRGLRPVADRPGMARQPEHRRQGRRRRPPVRQQSLGVDRQQRPPKPARELARQGPPP